MLFIPSRDVVNQGLPLESDIETLEAETPQRKRAERELRLTLRIVQDISAAGDFLSSVDVALRRITESTGWELGEAWIPSSDGTVLEYQIASYENHRTWSD